MSAMALIEWKHVTTRERGGRTVYYFRRRGYDMVRLPDDPKSQEFREAYDRAMRGEKAKARLAGKATFAWLCDRYMDSAAFKTKAPATRAARARIIASMIAEPIDPAYPETFGQEQVAAFGPDHIEALRDRKAATPHAANERLKILAAIFATKDAKAILPASPCIGVDRMDRPKGGHQTATDDEIDRYLAFHTEGPARLAMLLLMRHGMRVSDLRVIGRRNRRGNLLAFKTVKTGVLCEHDMSADVLDAIRLWGGDLAFVVTEHGRPFKSDKAISQRVAKWFRQAGIEEVTAHGVRKWLATRMAELGATEYELMAWFGWRDPKEARPYVEQANRRRMAASAGKLVALHRGS